MTFKEQLAIAESIRALLKDSVDYNHPHLGSVRKLKNGSYLRQERYLRLIAYAALPMLIPEDFTL